MLASERAARPMRLGLTVDASSSTSSALAFFPKRAASPAAAAPIPFPALTGVDETPTSSDSTSFPMVESYHVNESSGSHTFHHYEINDEFSVQAGGNARLCDVDIEAIVDSGGFDAPTSFYLPS